MSEKGRNTNKVLILIIIILSLGLIYTGVQLNAIKKKISSFSMNDSHEMFPFPKLSNSFGQFSPTPWDSFNQEWDPIEEFDRIQKEMNRMFKDSFGRRFGSNRFKLFGKNRPFDVDTDIREAKTHYTITMDIPGMDKAKIDIEVRDNMLIVSGERNELKEESQANRFFRRERSFGYFSRTVPLPEDAEAEGITAEYKRGVLIIKVPRAEGTKKTKESGRKINII